MICSRWVGSTRSASDFCVICCMNGVFSVSAYGRHPNERILGESPFIGQPRLSDNHSVTGSIKARKNEVNPDLNLAESKIDIAKNLTGGPANHKGRQFDLKLQT